MATKLGRQTDKQIYMVIGILAYSEQLASQKANLKSGVGN